MIKVVITVEQVPGNHVEIRVKNESYYDGTELEKRYSFALNKATVEVLIPKITSLMGAKVMAKQQFNRKGN